jgi:hypothetical protein
MAVSYKKVGWNMQLEFFLKTETKIQTRKLERFKFERIF